MDQNCRSYETWKISIAYISEISVRVGQEGTNSLISTIFTEHTHSEWGMHHTKFEHLTGREGEADGSTRGPLNKVIFDEIIVMSTALL